MTSRPFKETEAFYKYITDAADHCEQHLALETARADRAEAKVVKLREALNDVLTDNAQDTIEDPIGHEQRELNGFYRIGIGSLLRARAALAETEEKETP